MFSFSKIITEDINGHLRILACFSLKYEREVYEITSLSVCLSTRLFVPH
jgi:hypothetical protein